MNRTMKKFITITKPNNVRSLIRTENIYSVNELPEKGCKIVLECGTIIECIENFDKIIKSMSDTNKSIGFKQFASIQPEELYEYYDE